MFTDFKNQINLEQKTSLRETSYIMKFINIYDIPYKIKKQYLKDGAKAEKFTKLALLLMLCVVITYWWSENRILSVRNTSCATLCISMYRLGVIFLWRNGITYQSFCQYDFIDTSHVLRRVSNFCSIKSIVLVFGKKNKVCENSTVMIRLGLFYFFVMLKWF
jgi:hypothetical protein